MPVVRNLFIVSAVVSAPVGPALVFTPPLYSAPNPEHRESLEKRNLTQLAFAGKILFSEHCAACHGLEGQGTIAGPSLHHDIYKLDNLSRKAFHRAVTEGVPAQNWSFGDMPASAALSFNDVEKIARYIRELQYPSRYR